MCVSITDLKVAQTRC